MKLKEFNIPVPWGHVAVKAWGNEKNVPVIAMHGLADNANSYDRLIPYLPDSFYYICIDIPGHGKSSHFPPHLFVSILNNVLMLKLIVDYLNKTRYIIIGHSWAGQTSVLFAQIYPEHVLKLILLDSFYTYPVGSKYFKEIITEKIENNLRIAKNIMNNDKQRSFTFDEAVSKLINNRMVKGLLKEPAEVIISRSLISTGDGKYKITTDPRLKEFLYPIIDYTFPQQIIKAHPVVCPVLFISASQSELQYLLFKRFVDELQKYNKDCIVKQVDGSHDVHSNNPEIVGPIVSKFLLSSKSKL